MSARIGNSGATSTARPRCESGGRGETIPRLPRMYAAALCLAVAVLAAAVVTFLFAPRFFLWRGLEIADDLPALMAEFDRAVPTLAQLDDPWAPVNNRIHRVIAWRLLFPVMWHYLHLPRSWFLAMPQIGCLLSLWLVAWLTYERLGRWWPTCVATALFAALPWFFVSSGWLAHFDSWLVIGLLVASFVPSRFLLGLVCVLTPWVDARFVLALPVVLLVRGVALSRIERREWRAMLLDLAVVAAASFPYPAVRAVAWMRGDPESTAYVQSHWDDVRTVAWTRFGEGLWSGYRVAWLAVVAALVLAARRVGWRWGAALALVIVASALGGLFIAWDMSRTLMIVTPVFLLGLWLWEEQTSGPWKWLPSAVLVANLLLPAHHVLWSVEWPIAWLPAEIERWRHPPPIFAAVEFVHRARRLSAEGKYAEALANLNAAVRAEQNYAQARVERALLRLHEQDLAGAVADIEQAIAISPDYPYAFLLRGAMRRDLGHMDAAQDDLRHALEIAPADWQYRQTAQRLLEDVTGQK